MVNDNSHWLTGNGNTVNLWLDNWLGEPLVEVLKIIQLFHKTLKVKVGDWLVNCWEITGTVLTAYLNLINIISMSFPFVFSEDTLVWTVADDGTLSVKRAYVFILKPHLTSAWSTFPWHNNTPPTHSMSVWRYMCSL